MNEPQADIQMRLDLDPEAFGAVERLVAYEMGNRLLMVNHELQQRFGLRAEGYQVYLLIVLSTVQRFVRGLLDRGLIVERGRGCLCPPGGRLAALGRDSTPERTARRFVSTANAMLRLGAVRTAGTG